MTDHSLLAQDRGASRDGLRDARRAHPRLGGAARVVSVDGRSARFERLAAAGLLEAAAMRCPSPRSSSRRSSSCRWSPTIGLILGVIALATGRGEDHLDRRRQHRRVLHAHDRGLRRHRHPGVHEVIARAKSREAHTYTTTLELVGGGVTAHKVRAAPRQRLDTGRQRLRAAKQRFAVDPTPWQAEPWKTLGFSVDTVSQYQVRVTRNAQGFLVEARGDLDCDGQTEPLPAADHFEGAQPLEMTDELE